MVSIIVAIANDGAIGRNGDLICHISADLKRFKELTMGNTILMGRKTFESLPKRPLPGRKNVVITRNCVYNPEGAIVFDDLEKALNTLGSEENIFIIGGGEIYRQSIRYADRLYVTHIDVSVADADTFFPPIDSSVWTIENESETFTDTKSGITYRFIDYRKK